MDYEYVNEDNKKIKIKSEYPNIINLYKKHLHLNVETKENHLFNINSFILNLTYDNNEYAGSYFQNAVKIHFILGKGKHYNRNIKNEIHPPTSKSEIFDIYGKFPYKNVLKFDCITKEELSINYLPSIEKLSVKHLLNYQDISSSDFVMIIFENSYFYNKTYDTPLIDGGFIYKDPITDNFKIITYDTTVGEKKFSRFLDSLKIKDLEEKPSNGKKDEIQDREKEN